MNKYIYSLLYQYFWSWSVHNLYNIYIIQYLKMATERIKLTNKKKSARLLLHNIINSYFDINVNLLSLLHHIIVS
jgi:hypothetical protein